MKKTISILLFISILFFTGCGVKVTRIENTAPAPTESLSFDGYTTVTEPEEAVTEPSTETVTATVTATAAPPETMETTTRSAATAIVTSTTLPATTKKQWTTRFYPQPETKPTTTTQPQSTTRRAASYYVAPTSVNCSIEIECKILLDNIEALNEGKQAFVPESGYILKKVNLSLPIGSTVFDALKYACQSYVCSDECEFCKASGIQLEYVFTPGYNSEYIRGIHQLYEKDCGSRSGWMYSVNGTFPNYGCDKYTLKNGDKIKWSYTCDLGNDLK